MIITARRAWGGTGLIIVEKANIDCPMGSNGATQLRVDQDRFIPGLNRLVEAVKKYGTKICLQINHAGVSATVRKTGTEVIFGTSAIAA